MEVLALLQENAMQLLCTVAVIIGIIAGKVKTAEQAKKKREETLAKLQKQESKLKKKLQSVLKKEEKLEKELEK